MEPTDPPSLELPSPICDDVEDPEEALVRHVKASAKETLRLCSDLVDTRPARGLALLEHYAKVVRSFLVEISEPEEALRQEDDGPRLRPHDENPYLRQAAWETGLVTNAQARRNAGGMRNVATWAAANPYQVTIGGNPHGRAADFAARDDVRRAARAVATATGPEGAAMLDLVRINTNGLQFALRSARRLGDEGLMEQIRVELAQVLRLETEDEAEEAKNEDRAPIDLSQLDVSDLGDLVVPHTVDVPFEELVDLGEGEPSEDDGTNPDDPDEGQRIHEYDAGTFVCRDEDVDEEVQNPYTDGTHILGHDLRDPAGRRALLQQLDQIFADNPHRRRRPFDLVG